ncbi:hypothetical protein I79_020613 [Cricetulus griseus]|uniref:Uncharacterized protein n=1 Tax=Cricetulus griseus TaxID=10029 RepID=G3IAJ0_CRIGR|nr:hypothetical protein I79_020613 [Cricetulus griseus]
MAQVNSSYFSGVPSAWNLRILVMPFPKDLPMQHSQPLPALEPASLSPQPGMRIESSHCNAIQRNHDPCTVWLTTQLVP